MIKINKPKTFLPLSIAKGTTEERFAKATQSNLKFYKDLSYDFKGREMKLATFKRNLREATDNRIHIQTDANEDNLASSVTTSYWGRTNKFSGYTLKIPVRLWTDKVQQRTSPIFLNETQNFFSYIFNPKILTRKIAMSNKKHDFAGAEKFFKSNLSGAQKLDKEALNTLLVDKNYAERINILQTLRYDLMLEKSTKSAQFAIDKQIEKVEHVKMLGKNYDLSKFNYDEKLQVLNDKLASVLQKARELIQNSRQPKQC